MNAREIAVLAALLAGASALTAEEKLADIRSRVRQPRMPSGKNRDKVKAARKQRRKAKRP
ncbi:MULTISPECIES: hypothetical protein [Marinovum]|uniref:hypothetical protein n=1 Tax=Marinovum TaxID=367771 RepID=UPI00065B25EF|nr:hypothetical protein [Marinovum sp. PR37]AKO97617.1 hypothetical protein MALG_02453 [Marinovum algicola DG 898]MDD9744278.1 hypothetical protein [Marinovum sp. PR37]